MKRINSEASGSANDELSALMDTLCETGQRLEELTAGQVDTVVDSDGRILYLLGTQEQLQQSENSRQAAILNSLPAHIALLDSVGKVISVNDMWRKFAIANVMQGSGSGIGLNYLEICDGARGENSFEAPVVAEGIRSVLNGAKKTFSIEYPCHSPAEQRWFQLVVTPLRDALAVGAVVMHLNITEPYRVSRALRTSLHDFRTLAEVVPQIVWITRPDGGNIYFNQQWMDYTGLTLEESLGSGWNKPFHPEDKQKAWKAWQDAVATMGTYSIECRLRRADGVYRWWLIRGVALRDDAGNIVKWFGTCTDVQDLKMIEAALFAEKEYAQIRLNSIGDAVICTNVSGAINYLNSVAEELTGWTLKEAAGRPISEVLRMKFATLAEFSSIPIAEAIDQGKGMRLPSNGTIIRRDKSEIPLEGSIAPIRSRENQVTGAIIIVRDVSASRAMSYQMIHLAQHDSLTGLPNRSLLNDRVSQAITLAARHNKQIALLFLDLDGFKHINDSLGHSIGDKLLQSIAKRLVDCVRAPDTVSRQGGDEFVVLLSEVAHAEDAALTARRILKAVAEPQCIDTHDLHITTSVGLSVYPDDGLDAESLIKNADTAMYQAKENGSQSYQFFKPAMNARAVERQSIEEGLRRALERQEFALHYQPKVNLRTREIVGAEALLRWTHPTRGPVSPAQFISVAEDCGLILPISQWVLREACKQARAWVDATLPAVTMAVNISAMEFRQDSFLEDMFGLLRETGLDPRYLELELTEGVLMKRVESAASVLQALRAAGVQIAVDDFGTGYSSLSYLRRFPIDALKIDQSFVRAITTAPEDTTIVSAIISMGQSMKLRVIAEGVETQGELEFLKAHQCDEGQGYYFSRPIVPEKFAQLLKTGILQTVQK